MDRSILSLTLFHFAVAVLNENYRFVVNLLIKKIEVYPDNLEIATVGNTLQIV